MRGTGSVRRGWQHIFRHSGLRSRWWGISTVVSMRVFLTVMFILTRLILAQTLCQWTARTRSWEDLELNLGQGPGTEEIDADALSLSDPSILSASRGPGGKGIILNAWCAVILALCCVRAVGGAHSPPPPIAHPSTAQCKAPPKLSAEAEEEGIGNAWQTIYRTRTYTSHASQPSHPCYPFAFHRPVFRSHSAQPTLG